MADLHKWFVSSPYSLPHCDKYFKIVDPTSFANVISFENGFFDLDDVKCHKWKDCPECDGLDHCHSPPSTDMYHEATVPDFDEELPATPCWDKLLDHQFPDPDVKKLFQVLLGRLFYPVGKYDNWGVVPYMLGKSNTGKSTVGKVVNAMFPRRTVGTITNTFERKFGLAGLYQKRLINVMDVPKNFAKLLNQQDFQSMATADRVSIARKYLPAIDDQPWTVPFLLAANFIPDWKDESGSMSRRLAVFNLDTKVADSDRDTKLLSKILAAELVTVELTNIFCYRIQVDEVGSTDFWQFAPKLMKDVREKTAITVDPFKQLLAEGTSSGVQIKHVQGHCTWWKDFFPVWKTYMEDDHGTKNVKGNDSALKASIEAANFKIVPCKYVCVTCKQPATDLSRGDCKNHGTSRRENLRKKLKVIMHMQMLN